jgi:hypothetical protein
LNLAYRLRQKKLDLLAARAEAAGQARGELAAGATVNAFGDEPSVARLRAIDRELAKTEDALDRVYDMLRPGAERQTDRRTRAACIDFGQERLDAVQRALIEAVQSGATEPLPKLADRIHVSRAQFAETQGTTGGKVTITPSAKPKK